MRKVIFDLWNGSISPSDQCGKNIPEISELESLMERNRDSLCRIATPKQQELFGKYIDCSEEYLLRMTEEAFEHGFLLASKLLAEALTSDSY